MLTERTGQLIVVLLAAILGVLLIGRDSVGPAIFWGLTILAVLGVLYLLARLVSRGVSAFAAQASEERSEGGSAILMGVVWLGVLGLVIVAIWSGILSNRGIPFREGYQSIPFYWLPIVMVVGGLGANEGLKWLREKIEERRK